MLIFIHSSKTMRTDYTEASYERAVPLLIERTNVLGGYLATLSPRDIEKSMKVSPALAVKTKELIHTWNQQQTELPALDIFLGDIYSGLQVQSFSQEDRNYAHAHLLILSGLYGVLRALDGIKPYRLEMGYTLPGNKHDTSQPNITSLYEFWGETIAQQLPKNQDIINLSAVEYTKSVFPYFQNIEGLENVKIISPKFLTVSQKTNEPTFVTVHTKIARGTFARWLIQNRIESIDKLREFAEIGYDYDAELSTDEVPVYVAHSFKGLGLSVRKTS